MSLTTVKQINLSLYKTKAKIWPYGSKPLKCVGYFVGTIMYGSTVANTRIYVIKRPVKTLSGKLCAELEILKFHPDHYSTHTHLCIASVLTNIRNHLSNNTLMSLMALGS